MITLQEKIDIIVTRLRSISDDISSLFILGKSGLSEEEYMQVGIDLKNKIAAKAALEAELESLTDSIA